MSIAQVVRANEEAVRPREAVNAYLDRIADTMFDCVDAGTSAAGILPGGLDVPRRARALAGKLARRLTGAPVSMDEAGASQGGHASSSGTSEARAWAATTADPMRAMDWVNLFALAVNEENAAGHRVVTAPTNGAAGVIPAVLGYLVTHCPETGSVPGVAAGPATEDGAVQPLRHIRMTPSPSADSLAECTDSGDEATASSRSRVALCAQCVCALASSRKISTSRWASSARKTAEPATKLSAPAIAARSMVEREIPPST